MPLTPPPLPPGLANPQPIIIVCTSAWFAAALVLLILSAPAEWVWTCLTGGLLGFVGLAVMHSQRRAALRGSKGAQRGLI